MALVEGPPLWVEEKIHKMDKIEREREREREKNCLGCIARGEKPRFEFSLQRFCKSHKLRRIYEIWINIIKKEKKGECA